MAEVIDITELLKKRKAANQKPKVNWEISDEDYYTVCTLSTDELTEELVTALSSEEAVGMRNISVGALVAELVNRLDGLTVILEEAVSRYQFEHN